MAFNFGGKKKTPAAAQKPPVNNNQTKKVAPSSKPATPPKKTAQTPAPVQAAETSDFAGGLIGSDVEARQFDPFQLSAGRSAETLNWYRAAELKV